MRDLFENLAKNGAVFLPAATARSLEMANMVFQQIKAAVIPRALYDFYLTAGGVILGDACVFPPEDIKRPQRNYILPGLIKINRDMQHLPALRGKTVWGRNQLYFFSADISGAMYIHDVLTLMVLRKYDSLSAAMTDCLFVGRV